MYIWIRCLSHNLESHFPVLKQKMSFCSRSTRLQSPRSSTCKLIHVHTEDICRWIQTFIIITARQMPPFYALLCSNGPNWCDRFSWVWVITTLKVCLGAVNVHTWGVNCMAAEICFHKSQPPFFSGICLFSQGHYSSRKIIEPAWPESPPDTWGGCALLDRKLAVLPFSCPILFVTPSPV